VQILVQITAVKIVKINTATSHKIIIAVEALYIYVYKQICTTLLHICEKCSYI